MPATTPARTCVRSATAGSLSHNVSLSGCAAPQSGTSMRFVSSRPVSGSSPKTRTVRPVSASCSNADRKFTRGTGRARRMTETVERGSCCHHHRTHLPVPHGCVRALWYFELCRGVVRPPRSSAARSLWEASGSPDRRAVRRRAASCRPSGPLRPAREPTPPHVSPPQNDGFRGAAVAVRAQPVPERRQRTEAVVQPRLWPRWLS